MKTIIGQLELIHSGVIIPIEDHPISFELEDDVEGNYTINLRFIEEPNENESRTRFTVGENKFILNVDFVNFSRFNDVGNSELALIGSLKNRFLYFNYRLITVAGGKVIFYNFYIGEEVPNGN